jgi:ADP-ribosylglycohydrolase
MPVKKPDREQFSGALIGQCLGDALAFPVEGYVPEVCRQYVAGILRRGKGGSVGRPPFPFGQYTDDSRLAREILVRYREGGSFEPADYVSRIAPLPAGGMTGRGRATEEAAAAEPSAGKGSALGAEAIGLLFWDDPVELVRAARDQGRITHRDRPSPGGAVAVAGAVALALRGETERRSFLSRISEWSGSVDATMGKAVGSLEEWVDLPPGDALARIRSLDPEGADERQWRGISGFVVGSVLWSLYAFLRAPDDYWEAVCLAVSAGGDVDTMAATAGAVSGARLGIGALPRELTGRLTDGGTWGCRELRLLAEDCYRLKGGEEGG